MDILTYFIIIAGWVGDVKYLDTENVYKNRPPRKCNSAKWSFILRWWYRRGSAKQGFPRGEAVKIGSSEPILTDEECGQKSESLATV